MKISILILSFFIMRLIAMADEPAAHYRYELFSENGKYYSQSIPYFNFLYLRPDFGKTFVYKTETNELIYTIDKYIPLPSFLSNDGNIIVSIEGWLSNWSSNDDEKIVDVYRRNKDIKSYSFQYFKIDTAKLIFTESHAIWLSYMFEQNDTLNLLTTDDFVYRFCLAKGQMIDPIPKMKFRPFANFDRFNNNLPKTKEVEHSDEKTPDFLPDLENGKSFRESFAEEFNLGEPLKKSKENSLKISIYAIINQNGSIDTLIVGAYRNGDDKIFEEKAKQWIQKQRFVVEKFPSHFDKWGFQEELYIK